MNQGKVEIFSDIFCSLGECPLWDSRENAVFWIDSLSGILYRADQNGAVHSWKAPQEIGCFVLCESGGALCALRDGIYRLNFESGRFNLFKRTPNDPAKTRLNDGKCDGAGRFWVGSLTEGSARAEAVLYRIDPDGRVVEALHDIWVSNGLAFPPGRDFFYHSDSRVGRVDRVFYNADGDDGFKRSLFFQTDKEIERPDGAAVDEEGCYWSAYYGGGAIVRVLPSGDEVYRLKLPTAYPTMVRAGSESLLQYSSHLEACYCIDGEGEVEDMNGNVYPIKRGDIYVLDQHDRHYLRGGKDKDLILVSVFTPPLKGTETHDLKKRSGSAY